MKTHDRATTHRSARAAYPPYRRGEVRAALPPRRRARCRQQDLKRYSDFVNHKIYDLLAGQESARTNGRDGAPPLDLPFSVEAEQQLACIARGLSVALARSFKIIDPNLKNPGSGWRLCGNGTRRRRTVRDRRPR